MSVSIGGFLSRERIFRAAQKNKLQNSIKYLEGSFPKDLVSVHWYSISLLWKYLCIDILIARLVREDTMTNFFQRWQLPLAIFVLQWRSWSIETIIQANVSTLRKSIVLIFLAQLYTYFISSTPKLLQIFIHEISSNVHETPSIYFAKKIPQLGLESCQKPYLAILSLILEVLQPFCGWSSRHFVSLG